MNVDRWGQVVSLWKIIIATKRRRGQSTEIIIATKQRTEHRGKIAKAGQLFHNTKARLYESTQWRKVKQM